MAYKNKYEQFEMFKNKYKPSNIFKIRSIKILIDSMGNFVLRIRLSFNGDILTFYNIYFNNTQTVPRRFENTNTFNTNC